MEASVRPLLAGHYYADNHARVIVKDYLILGNGEHNISNVVFERDQSASEAV
tara:strand:+ start:776 stop:931 length:156 start_codon:yes stop_codon:yes gene_type:complete